MGGQRTASRKWAETSGGYEAYTPTMRISVHRYMGEPKDAWFLTCYDLGVQRMPLKSKTTQAAQAEAMSAIREHVRKLANELSELKI
jgi:hypothetical protein